MEAPAPASALLQRPAASFRATHQRFVVRAGARHYEVQYSHIYKGRIAELRPVVLHAARQRWPERDGGCSRRHPAARRAPRRRLARARARAVAPRCSGSADAAA